MEIWQENPFYWAYKGRPILLLGGSDEDNLFNHPALWANLCSLSECGGNYVRCTMSSRDPGNVWPYARVGERYDLTKPNPEYWERLERFLQLAQEREIIVQIEFWATFDFYQEHWLRNPFNPSCNVNYTYEETQLCPRWEEHPAHSPQPFFFSPPTLNDDRVLLPYQQDFVRRVLEVALPYENVLYCLDNETATAPEWAWYWGEFVQEEARKRGKRIYLTEMYDPWDLRHWAHQATYTRPDLFAFVEVSQNNWQEGRTHYERLLWMREQLLHSEFGPRPMNNVKVYGCPRPRTPAQVGLSLDRFWQNIFAGCASTRFHRPPSGLGLNEVAWRTIRAARLFTDAFDIFATAPRPDLLQPVEGEAYCLAAPGKVYALYFPKGGEVILQLEGGPFQLRWFDAERLAFGSPQRVEGGALRLRAPSERLWLVLLQLAGEPS